MGKTLGNIIAVGVAIGVNVIPGVGQVISGAIVGTLGTAIAGAIQLGTLAYGLQAGASLLGLGPSVGKPETSSVTIKLPRHGSCLYEPWESAA